MLIPRVDYIELTYYARIIRELIHPIVVLCIYLSSPVYDRH